MPADFPLITCVYRLPDERRLTFYTSPEQFQEHVEKHFLNPSEPWGRFLKVKFLQQLGRKLKAGDVSVLEEAYQKAFDVIDEGMRFAENEPLFVWVRQWIEPPGGAGYGQDVVYLLADRGFRIVARGGAVRTAFFSNKAPNDSNLTLYLEAWRAVKAHAAVRQYTDEETGNWIVNTSAKWHNAGTWGACPIPARYLPPAPAPGAGCDLPPEAREWLDAL